MLCGGTRNEELAVRVKGADGKNGITNHDGLLIETAVAKLSYMWLQDYVL